MVQSLWKKLCWFLTKLNILLPPDIAVVLLSIYPKELKTYIHTETCTQMFIATWFIVAKTWKQPRCPSVGEWINILWYIQTTEYYSKLIRNELSSHEKTWKNLKCILLRERSQSEKTTPGSGTSLKVGGGMFPTPTSNSPDTSWMSYNSTQFWHYLPRESFRSHSLRTQSYKTIPYTVSDTCCKSRLSPVLLTNQLEIEASSHPSLGSVNLLEWLAHRTQRSSFLTRLLFYYERM